MNTPPDTKRGLPPRRELRPIKAGQPSSRRDGRLASESSIKLPDLLDETPGISPEIDDRHLRRGGVKKENNLPGATFPPEDYLNFDGAARRRLHQNVHLNIRTACAVLLHKLPTLQSKVRSREGDILSTKGGRRGGSCLSSTAISAPFLPHPGR